MTVSAPPTSFCELTFPDTTFAEDVEIMASLGVGGLGVDENKLDGEDLEGCRNLLVDAGVKATLCTPTLLAVLPLAWTHMFPGPTDPDDRVEGLLASLDRLSVLEPETVFLVTGPVGEFGEARARSIVVEAMRTLADRAKALGTRVSIEPMREEFRAEWSMTCSLREALDLLDDVGRDDVGIVFDIWHVFGSPDVWSLLPEAIPRSHGVQVADYRDPTRGPLDRVPTGKGIAEVDRFLYEIRAAGFEGWYDLEVFSDDGRFGSRYEDSYWKLEPTEFARVQLEGFQEAWNAASAGVTG